ncbi:MAG: SHOCT domain-containing protein [Paludibacteraceae bacterium]|nr:SHOCT domain-containing protein [Paludibacteraceae bacterium]
MIYIIGLLIIVMIVSVVMFFISESKKPEERKNKFEMWLKTIPGFNPSQIMWGYGNYYMFAIDKIHKKIAYSILEKKPSLSPDDKLEKKDYLFNFEDVISVEKIHNGSIVLQKSTTRTIGGAIIGGVLGGGIGSVIGGLSGSATKKEMHSSLKVKVLLRNNEKQSVEIDCFNSELMCIGNKTEVDDDDFIYQTCLKQTNEIADLFCVIIDSIDKEQVNNSQVNSIADELTKLLELKNKGILSETEFEIQKTKLLSR